MKAKVHSASKKRVFIVDDHPMMRLGLAQFLASEPSFEVCGDAPDAKTALSRILAQKPDLIVLDISLPGKSGLEMIKELRQLYPRGKILAHSMHDERIYGERALRAGAMGYLMKKDSGEELIDAIQTVLAGGTYRGKMRQENDHNGSQGAHSLISLLSDRELEVFEAIGRGEPNVRIAQRLHLSIKTIDAHREHIKRKLGIKSGTELNLFAVRWVTTEIALSERLK